METGRIDVRILTPADALAELCRRHGIREQPLFGSVLLGDFTPDSDVDAPLEFEDDFRDRMFTFFGIEGELTGLAERPVDLVEKGALHPVIKDAVLGSRRIVYVAT